MRLVYIVCLSVLLSLISPAIAFAEAAITYDDPTVDYEDVIEADDSQEPVVTQEAQQIPNADMPMADQYNAYGAGRHRTTQVCAQWATGRQQNCERWEGEPEREPVSSPSRITNEAPTSSYQTHGSHEVPVAEEDRVPAQQEVDEDLVKKRLQQRCIGGNQSACDELMEKPSTLKISPTKVVAACKSKIEFGEEGNADITNARNCIIEECTVNNKVDNSCVQSSVAGVKNYASSINSFTARYNTCVAEKAPEADQCCGQNLSESSCGSDAMATIVQGTNDISQTIQIAASYTSPAAVCQANKQAYQIASGLLLTATAICAKAATECNAGCSLSGISCDSMLGSPNSADDETNPNFQQCKKMARTMKSKRNGCYLLQAGNLAKAGLTHTTNKYQKKFNECSKTLTTETEVDCTLQENIDTKPECGKVPTICAQPGSENLEICRDQTANTGVAQTGGDVTLPSGETGSGSTAGSDGGSAFGDDDEEQGFDPLNGALANANDSGGNQKATGSGGASLGGTGGGAGGGSGGGRSGKAGPGKDRNILRGTSSGNGYVSRFRGSSGGGYKAKSYSRSSSSRGSRGGSPKFNLKKFLPKSKKITKGRLKGYNRLPSGNLMVPQSFDIFDVHHKSYQKACKRGRIIKGCGPAASKKLGFAPTVRDLNSRYRAQLALQKETQQQRLSRSGLRVRSLKNNISAQASTTYYQIKYLNKNKLRKLPAKDPLAAIGKKDTRKYKDWHKMQSWINSKTKAVTTPGSSRIPASVK